MSGVEAEAAAQLAYLAALDADLPEDPGGSKWPGAREIVVAQGADPLSDRAVEAADLLDLECDWVDGHSLIIVRE
jgi:hypothetical protein